MTSAATIPERVTYLARECEVSIRADHDSGRVTIGVAGQEAELSAQSAERVAAKLTEAVRRAGIA